MKLLITLFISLIFTFNIFADDKKSDAYEWISNLGELEGKDTDVLKVNQQDMRCVMRVDMLNAVNNMDYKMMYRNPFGPREKEVICDNYAKGFARCMVTMQQLHPEMGNRLAALKNTEFCMYFIMGYNEGKFQWRATQRLGASPERPVRHLANFYKSFTYKPFFYQYPTVENLIFHMDAQDQNMDDSIFDHYPQNLIRIFDISYNSDSLNIFSRTKFRIDAVENGYNEYRRFLAEPRSPQNPNKIVVPNMRQLPKDMFDMYLKIMYSDSFIYQKYNSLPSF